MFLKTVTEGNDRSSVYMDDLDSSIFETPSVPHFRLTVWWLKNSKYSMLLRIMVEDEFYAYHSAIGCTNKGCTTWRRNNIKHTTTSSWPSTGFCNWQDLYDDIYEKFDFPKITRSCGECIFQHLANSVTNNYILSGNQTRLAAILHYASKRSCVWSPLVDATIFKDALDVFKEFDTTEVSCVREYRIMHCSDSYVQQLIIYAASRTLRFCTGTNIEVKHMNTWTDGVVENTLLPVTSSDIIVSSAYKIRLSSCDHFITCIDDDYDLIRKKVLVKTDAPAEAFGKQSVQIDTTPNSKKKKRKKKKNKSSSTPVSSNIEFQDGDYDELFLEDNVAKQDSADNLCIICHINAPNFVYIPCGHMVTCNECVQKWSEKSDNCPYCMLPASSFKVFMQ